MEKALSNITVLDLTRVLAGPYCTMMLADYGANVIKIEMPGKGDDTRAMGPKKNDYSMYYAYVNRGKKGITLNLKSEEGKKLFLEMVKKADVVVENYRWASAMTCSRRSTTRSSTPLSPASAATARSTSAPAMTSSHRPPPAS